MKQAPSNTRLRRVFSAEIFAEWCDMERSMTPMFRKSFTRLERIIIFCKIVVGWGMPQMIKRLKISQRQIANTYKRLEECGYGNINIKTKKGD
jgi:hypothetical protein